MTDSDFTIVSLLGAVDAVWLPARSFERPFNANVYAARRDFPRHGVRWHTFGKTEAHRKRIQRAVDQLARQGLIDIGRRGRSDRTSFLKLSDVAEAAARRLVGLPPLATAIVAVRELAKHSERGGKLMQERWVPEITMNDGRGWGDDHSKELAVVQDMLLPALCREWVIALADAHRCVYYALTRDGWTIAKAEASADKPEKDQSIPQANRVYSQALEATLDSLRKTEPETGELGFLPIPVSHHGCHLGPWDPEKFARAA